MSLLSRIKTLIFGPPIAKAEPPKMADIALKETDVLPDLPDDSGFYDAAEIAEARQEAMARAADTLNHAATNGRLIKATKVLRKLRTPDITDHPAHA